jgi:hypothetical protein
MKRRYFGKEVEGKLILISRLHDAKLYGGVKVNLHTFVIPAFQINLKVQLYVAVAINSRL